MKLKIPSRIRIAAFCMWIVLRLKPRLSLITLLSVTPLSPPAPPKIHTLVFSLAHHPLSSKLMAPAIPSLSLPHATALGAGTAQTPMASTVYRALAYIKSCSMSSDAPFNEEMRKNTLLSCC